MLIVYLRIAIACGSPRVASGYDESYYMLRDCDTLETKKIFTILLLHQGGKEPIPDKKDDGIALFIDGNSEGMKVFMPRKRADRDACFQSKLPKHLLEWIMSYPETNITGTTDSGMTRVLKTESIRIVQAVLSAHTCALKSIIDEYGMPEVSAQYGDDVDDDDDSDNDSQREERSVGNDEDQRGQALSYQRQSQLNYLGDERVAISHTPTLTPTTWSDTEDERHVLNPAPSTTSVDSASVQESKNITTSRLREERI